MSRLEFTLDASFDFDEIYDHIAERSPRRAHDFIDRLQIRCAFIAESPGIGRRREELTPGLQSLPESDYVIYYRQIEGGVRIMRILHGARDISRLSFAKPDEDE